MVTVTRSFFSATAAPSPLHTFLSALCNSSPVPKIQIGFLREWAMSCLGGQAVLRMQPLPPFHPWQCCSLRSPQELSRGGWSSHQPFSLLLAIDFLEIPLPELPRATRAGLSWNSLCCWELDESNTSSALPGLSLGSEIPGSQLRLFQAHVFILIWAKGVSAGAKPVTHSKGTNPSVNGRGQNGLYQTLPHIPRLVVFSCYCSIVITTDKLPLKWCYWEGMWGGKEKLIFQG